MKATWCELIKSKAELEMVIALKCLLVVALTKIMYASTCLLKLVHWNESAVRKKNEVGTVENSLWHDLSMENSQITLLL